MESKNDEKKENLSEFVHHSGCNPCEKCRKTDDKEIELKKKSELGDKDAQFELAEIYKHKKCYCYEKLAIEHYLMAGNQGHSKAQFKLGCIYLWGPDGDVPDLKVDRKEAYEWFVLSAINGDSEARFMLRAEYKVEKNLYDAVNEAGEKTKHELNCGR